MTAGSDIPAQVQDFLREHVSSYEQLEILFLLRAQPARAWSAEQVVVALPMAQTLAEEALRALCRENLLKVEVGSAALLFRYQPQRPEDDETIGKLHESYQEHRLEIVKLMTTQAVDRLRTSALRKFSDSFVLRKKKKDG